MKYIPPEAKSISPAEGRDDTEAKNGIFLFIYIFFIWRAKTSYSYQWGAD